MQHQIVSVTEFKAKCLALLTQVEKQGGTITITKRGRPLATVGPVKKKKWKSSEGILEGIVDIPDEVLMADTSHLWNILHEPFD